jgi:4-amino-4-deoxy-L-arabinose transferase-like glycosyltransferase
MTPAIDRRLYTIAAAVIAAITLVRIAVLIVSPLELYPDEAQYWFWAQTPALGYFSKPPMIGWIVWLTTHFFGNSEWAIRLSSPLLHAGSALFVYGIAKRLSDSRVGMWSAAAYITLPGLSYSSGLVSTDVPLLFFWSMALYAFVRAADDKGWRWPILCGIGLGLGLMSKYAMLYFVLGAVVAAIAIPKVRKLVVSARGLVILLIGLALLSPNIWWNWAHGFPTVAHTASNADWSHPRFDIVSMLSFLGGQFGVFGPVMMVAFFAALWKLTRARDDRDLLLAAFSVPPILIIAVQAFISEANANWAATAYVAATPLAIGAMLSIAKRWPLYLSLGFDSLAMAVLWIIAAAPHTAGLIGQGNAFKREEGWRKLCLAAVEEAWNRPYDTVAVANRSVIAEMLYYGKSAMLPIRMWDADAHDDDHFQMTIPLTGGNRILLVLYPSEERAVLPTFDSAKRVGRVSVAVGGHHTRTFDLFDARGFHGARARR